MVQMAPATAARWLMLTIVESQHLASWIIATDRHDTCHMMNETKIRGCVQEGKIFR